MTMVGVVDAASCNGDVGADSPPPAYTETDPWALAMPPDTGKPWKELTNCKRGVRVLTTVLKVCGVLLLLYFFIISIDLLGSAFQLLAGRTAGLAFTNSAVLSNPVCCMIIGVGVTVLLQSSSTSTSIVVTMVAAGVIPMQIAIYIIMGANIATSVTNTIVALGQATDTNTLTYVLAHTFLAETSLIPVQNAIYIIMGANIGTSVTNTIVALGQAADRDQFRRAFAGATVHDAFNWITVLILLPVEIATGYLYRLTGAIVSKLDVSSDVETPMFLEVITDPLTSSIISVDKKVIYGIAQGNFAAKRPLCKYLCEEDSEIQCIDYPTDVDVTASAEYIAIKESRLFPDYWAKAEKVVITNVTCNGTAADVQQLTYELPIFKHSSQTETCTHWFTGAGLPGGDYSHPAGWASMNLSDVGVGAILLVVSLVMLCGCLIAMVKLLSSLLQGAALKAVHSVLNTELQCGDNPPKWRSVLGRELAGYLAILAGCGLTILVQSSSVFTSAMTPLVGMGLITVERMYPLTLGANIGTTVTSLLAAFTSSADTLQDSLQVALAHLFFNITGILLFYPAPPLRRIPTAIAKRLGATTARYRWFAVVYLIVVFFLLPVLVFALSIPGWYVLAAVLIPAVLLAIFVVGVNISQNRCPARLPRRLQTWAWLPGTLRSLEPYDRLFRRVCRCCKICRQQEEDEGEGEDVDGKEQPDVVVTVKDGQVIEVKNGDITETTNGQVTGMKNGHIKERQMSGEENPGFENGASESLV